MYYQFSATVWDPYHICNINKIEMIQHRAAHFVLGCPWRRDHRDSITSLLSSLERPSLQLRRKCSRLTSLFMLLHNVLVISPEYLPVPLPVTKMRANHDFKFLHYQTSVDCYKFSFSKNCSRVECSPIMYSKQTNIRFFQEIIVSVL